MFKTPEAYETLRTNLILDFRHAPPKSKNELRIQMMILKYRIKEGTKLYPTEKQLDTAWDILKDEGILVKTKAERKEIEEKIFFRVETYRDRRVYRATEESFIYNEKLKKIKKYRKGWFLPKQRK